jgi:acetylornithine deacetylase
MTLPTELRPGSARDLLSALVAIPSVNPAYDPASPGENEIGDAIVEWGRALGLESHERDVVDGRRNIQLRLRSRSPRRTILIEGHLDTVGLMPPGAGTVASVVDGRLSGRGACDAKGAIAATLLALAELVAAPPEHTDVVFLGAIDEEYVFRGISAFIADGELPDAAVVLEPTDLRIVTEHNGVVRIELVVAGVAAHSSRPEEGHNAILDALEVVRVLTRWTEDSTAAAPGSPPRILAVTTVSGGTAINVIPDSCRIGLDLRIRPAEHPDDVLAEIEALLAAIPGVDARIDRVLLTDGGMSTNASSDVVVAAQTAAGLHQLPVGVVRVPYGTDGSKLARAGVPTIVFGPGSIRTAHGDDEWVDLADVETAARVIRDLVRAFDRAEP